MTTDPNVTTTGTVHDADGIPVEVGKDYGMLTLKVGGKSARLDDAARSQFIELCMRTEADLFWETVEAAIGRQRPREHQALRAVPDAKEGGQ